MVSKNFKWFLHAMLVYHVQHVLDKIGRKEADEDDDDEFEAELSSIEYSESASSEEMSDEEMIENDSDGDGNGDGDIQMGEVGEDEDMTSSEEITSESQDESD